MTIPTCPHCGHNLTGLPEFRCPECGRPFDPAILAHAYDLPSREIIEGRGELARRAHFGAIITVQAVAALALSTVLDGGTMLTSFLISMLAYWGGVGMVMIRRRTLTPGDLTFVQIGWLPIAFGGMLVIGVLRDFLSD